MRKKNGSGGFLTSDYTTKLQQSKLYGTGTKKRHTDQWNKTGSPDATPRTYGHLIFTKEERIYNGAKTDSLINGAGKTGQLHVKD